MNIKQLVTTAAFLVAISLAAPSAYALSAADAKAVKKAVTSVPLPEMPAKAAELVKNASKADREAVAVTATRAAIYKSRSSAPQIVASISKVAPDLAPAVSMAAAEMEGNQAGLIARAASIAAPGSKAQIFSSVNTGASLGMSVSSGNTVPSSAVTANGNGGFVSAQANSFSGRGFGTSRSTLGSFADPVIVVVNQSNNSISDGNHNTDGSHHDPAGDPVILDYHAPR